MNREVITENLTPGQVMEIRREAKLAGAHVNVTRLSPRLVEIEIIYRGRIIEGRANA